MRNIYETYFRMRKTTLHPTYTEWLERFVNENNNFSDWPEDSVFLAQTGQDLINISIIALFSSMVMGYAERMGFRQVDMVNHQEIWSATLNLSKETSVKIEYWYDNNDTYTRIFLIEPGSGEIELDSIIYVFK